MYFRDRLLVKRKRIACKTQMNYMQNADTIYIISLNDKICFTNNDKVRALTDAYVIKEVYLCSSWF